MAFLGLLVYKITTQNTYATPFISYCFIKLQKNSRITTKYENMNCN